MAEQLDIYTKDDARIDDYIRGRMSEDEELAFEAEFIADPVLFEKVEMMSRLKDGLETLSENGELAVTSTPHIEDQLDVQASSDQPLSLEKVTVKRQDSWLKYFAVPQTALGAFAASLLLVPLLILNAPEKQQAAILEPSFYAMDASSMRGEASDTTQTHIIHVDDNTGRAIFEFSVAPFITAPPTYHMRFTDEHGKQIWQKDTLSISADLKLYVEVDLQTLSDGIYYFDLTEIKSSAETHTRKGIEIRHRG